MVHNFWSLTNLKIKIKIIHLNNYDSINNLKMCQKIFKKLKKKKVSNFICPRDKKENKVHAGCKQCLWVEKAKYATVCILPYMPSWRKVQNKYFAPALNN